jgi:hypothetical protein
MKLWKPLAVLATALVIVGLSVPMSIRSRASAATPSLVAWTAVSDSNAIDIVVDDLSGLGGEHPLDEIDIPEDSADFETGDFGNGLASVAWPGQTGGNVGSLSALLPIPTQLQPLLADANDPVKAETFYPAGPDSATYPSGTSSGVVEMSSKANATGVTAAAAVTDVSDTLISVQGVQGSSNATADTSATATATANSGRVSLLGGLITIGSVISTANATSDGTTGSGKTNTTVGNVAIDGTAVGVDSNGITGPVSIGGLGSVLGTIDTTIDSLISALGLTIHMLPSSSTTSGAAASYTSGGLQISFTLPPSVNPSISLPSALPSAITNELALVTANLGLLQGANITITLGRATATAVASSGFGDTSNPTPLPSLSNTSASLPSSGFVPTSSGATGLGTTIFPGGATAGGSPKSGGPAPTGTISYMSYNQPTPLGMFIFGLLLAGVAGALIIAAARRVRRSATPVCPLEKGKD